MATKSLASCIFCRIIKGEIPSFKLLETEYSYSFLDIGPLSRGHALVIPKYHAEKLHECPDEYLADPIVVAKKVAGALGLENYNLLQNNGKIAHQVVPHVHFHVIPKPGAEGASHEELAKSGLVIGWPAGEPADKGDLKALQEEILKKLEGAQ